MRILIIRLNTSNFGKIGTYNVQEVGLANALIKRGHKADVVFLHKDTNKVIDDENYNFVHYLPHVSFGIHGIFKVRLLEQYRPDRIIMWSDNQLWAKNVIRWSKKHSIPVIQYFGGVLSDNPKFLHQLYTKLILLRNKKSYRYSLNIAKTSRVENEMKKHGIKSFGKISIGVDTTLLSNEKAIDYEERNELGFSKTDKIILFIGRMDTEKKPFFACEVLKALAEIDSSYKMIMIGDGRYSEQIDNYIKEEHLEKIITHIHKVPYKSIHKYMVISDCFVNYSEIEIFGMAILEAMYYGLPVVVHSAPGPNDYIDDCENGYIVNSYNVNDWCDKIQTAILNKNVVATNGIATILQKYNWDILVNDFLNVM